MLVQIVGYGAAFLTMFGFLPQVIKIYQTKSVKDISFLTLAQFSVGLTLWLIYGIMRRDFVIILANTVTLLIVFVGVCLYFRYRK
jgi:MtN3 and saliva related transmembrane protein